MLRITGILVSLLLLGCQSTPANASGHQDSAPDTVHTPQYVTKCDPVYDAIPLADYTYYDSLIGLTGDELRSAINELVALNHQKVFSYKCVWTALSAIDTEATEIGSSGSTEHVIGLYSRSKIPSCLKYSSSAITCRELAPNKTPEKAHQDEDAWNREHTWAKSHGFKYESGSKKTPPYNDLHHLRAEDKSVNSDKNEDDFGYVSPEMPKYRVPKQCPDCEESNTRIWEPGEGVRGDVARMMFYMDVRYEGKSNDGFANDLVLVDRETELKTNEHGILCDLYKWHLADPVSDAERRRNNLVQMWQGNRNPFIDRPDLVKELWSDKCDQ